MVRRALTRQTRWYQNRCSTFKIKDFIVQKPFWKILEFWPLVISILTWAKKWPIWFRNDFSRAFECRFPFCSTMRRSRDRRGGVFKHPPPPPAGGGKSRGPAGRGLTVFVTVKYGCWFLPVPKYFRDRRFQGKRSRNDERARGPTTCDMCFDAQYRTAYPIYRVFSHDVTAAMLGDKEN